MERRRQPPAERPAGRQPRRRSSRRGEPHVLANLVAGASQMFIGVGGLYGGLKLLRDPGEFGLRLEWLQDSPFADYSVPGLFLFWVLGAGMLLAAAATAFRVRAWPGVAFLMGSLLAAWLVIQTAVLGSRGPEQVVLLTVTGIPALLMIVAGASAMRSPSSGVARAQRI